MRKLSMITLGVADLQRSIRFYELTLEFKRMPFASTTIAFFDLDGPKLALFGKIALAEDAQVSPEGYGFTGITRAQNVALPAEVTAILQKAVDAGGTLIKRG